MSTSKNIVLSLGALTLATSLASYATGENPFATKSLSQGYQVAEHDDKSKDGKCGTGKCGAEKKAKAKDGKCGTGKCGAEKMKEGSCGGEKKLKKVLVAQKK